MPDQPTNVSYPPIRRRRVATPAFGATMRWHYLADRVERGVAYAICGEGHRRWWPLHRFMNSDAFSPCDHCSQVHETANRLREMASAGELALPSALTGGSEGSTDDPT